MDVSETTARKTSLIPPNFRPRVDIFFTTLEVAGKFYNNYAYLMGFGTRIGKSIKTYDKSRIKWIQFIFF